MVAVPQKSTVLHVSTGCGEVWEVGDPSPLGPFDLDDGPFCATIKEKL